MASSSCFCCCQSCITTSGGNNTYGAWRAGGHDNLVLAVALACWWGENAPGQGLLEWMRQRAAVGMAS
jgi:hypothetical protein